MDFVWHKCRKVICGEVHSWVWDVAWGGSGGVLIGELVVGSVSFCVISFIAGGMGNCDSGVSSIIVDDSVVVCDCWSFCCADSFCSSTSDALFGFRLRSACPLYITWTHIPKIRTAFGKRSFMLEHLHTRVVVW